MSSLIFRAIEKADLDNVFVLLNQLKEIKFDKGTKNFKIYI